MTMRTVQLPEDIKALAESRAAEAGCVDVGEYLAQLVRGEATSAPEGLAVGSDEDLKALLLRRLDGPSVEMDKADGPVRLAEHAVRSAAVAFDRPTDAKQR